MRQARETERSIGVHSLMQRPGEGARPPNKGMKQTSVEHIGRSQLIPGVRRLIDEREKPTNGD